MFAPSLLELQPLVLPSSAPRSASLLVLFVSLPGTQELLAVPFRRYATLGRANGVDKRKPRTLLSQAMASVASPGEAGLEFRVCRECAPRRERTNPDAEFSGGLDRLQAAQDSLLARVEEALAAARKPVSLSIPEIAGASCPAGRGRE